MLRYLLMLVTLSSLTGIVVWWQMTIPIEKSSLNEQDDWKLPVLPKLENIQASYAKLRTLSPWKTNESTKLAEQAKKTQQEATLQQQALPPPKKVDWQLMGIIQHGPRRYILLFDDKTTKVTSYSLQSTLPNGDTLINIREDSVEVLRKGKTEIVRLYP